ncbi:MAG: aa3-type cytochrome c oxidase subunit IV [Methylocystis sp.]|jgi:hypothetical protein
MGDSNHGYADAGADYSDHLKTYQGFLKLLVFGAVASVVTLVALYFSLAR